MTISSTVYANASHAISPDYDYVIVNYGASPAAGKKMPITRGKLIAKLFPDLDAYAKGERARWAMGAAKAVDLRLTAAGSPQV